jgi:hypothetical protein
MATDKPTLSASPTQSLPHDPAPVLPTPRAELLTKINAITAGMAQWHELLTALVEGFPPTAGNLAQVARLGAGLLMQEGAELAELSGKLKAPMMLPAVVAKAAVEVQS